MTVKTKKQRIFNARNERPRYKLRPSNPSAREIEEHNITHISYRAWCPACVMEHCKNDPHKRTGRESNIPIVSIDYTYMTRDKMRDQQKHHDDPKNMPTLHMHDRQSRMLKSEIVPAKGANQHAADALRRFIEELGYKEVIIKSDQENAILSLNAKVVREINIKTKCEKSPVGEASSNGSIQNAIGRSTALMRTLKVALESKLGTKMQDDCDCIPWMVRHAANLISWLRQDENGRTSYHRNRRRAFNKLLAQFCESVFHLMANTLSKNKFNPRWEIGVWLGVLDTSGEYVIGTPNGIIKVRT